ncbi:MAG: ferredoxin family protein [Candidatus Hydrogenedentes bacterium]|nr:ferredoxin family protein [Candidatus Hydrogenedentota bacterium]
MAYVVTEPCIKCKYTDCVKSCPVICFHEGANFLVIDPDDCIDCGACVDHCPVNAIYPQDTVPAKWHSYILLNRKYSRIWPALTGTREPLPSAEEFSKILPKADHFDENPGEGDAM